MTTFISPPCVCVCVWALRLSVWLHSYRPHSSPCAQPATYHSIFPSRQHLQHKAARFVSDRKPWWRDVDNIMMYSMMEVEEMLHGEKVVMHSCWNNQTLVKNNIVLERDSDMKHHTSVIKTHMELLIIQKCRGMHVQTCQHSGFLSRSFSIFNLLSLAVRVIGHFLALISQFLRLS